MIIKCTCGDKNCTGYVSLDGASLWVQNGKEQEAMIYLDANAKVQLIKELKDSLV